MKALRFLLRPLAADGLPAGKGGDAPGKVRQSGGDIDILGADSAALAAVHAAARLVFQRLHAHGGDDAATGIAAQVVVNGQQQRDIQLGRTPGAAVIISRSRRTEMTRGKRVLSVFEM